MHTAYYNRVLHFDYYETSAKYNTGKKDNRAGSQTRWLILSLSVEQAVVQWRQKMVKIINLWKND